MSSAGADPSVMSAPAPDMSSVVSAAGAQGTGVSDYPNSVQPTDPNAANWSPASFGNTPGAQDASGMGPLGTMMSATGGDPTAAGGMGAVMHWFGGVANVLGDTPAERTKNAGALAAAFKDLGSLGDKLQQSTLLQRMYKLAAKHPPFQVVQPGGSNADVTARSYSSNPQSQQPIMSQMGFK